MLSTVVVSSSEPWGGWLSTIGLNLQTLVPVHTLIIAFIGVSLCAVIRLLPRGLGSISEIFSLRSLLFCGTGMSLRSTGLSILSNGASLFSVDSVFRWRIRRSDPLSEILSFVYLVSSGIASFDRRERRRMPAESSARELRRLGGNNVKTMTQASRLDQDTFRPNGKQDLSETFNVTPSMNHNNYSND